MTPLFSIIIPVYNVEQYLRDCLISVLSQAFTDYEVICVNDGSTDGSLKILEEYAEKYSQVKIINQQNAGTAAARNAGIEVAKGEYIWFVDSDDWITDNALQVLDRATEGKEDVICFNGKLMYDDSGKEESDEGITDRIMTGWEYYNKYALIPRKFSFVCVVLRLYRREFLTKSKLYFDTTVTHEDNLWIPVALYYARSVSFSPETLYVYRKRTTSKSGDQTTKPIYDVIQVNNRLSAFFHDKNEISRKTLYRYLSNLYAEMFYWFIHVYQNDRDEFEKFYTAISWEYYKRSSRTVLQKIYYGLLLCKMKRTFNTVYYIDNHFLKKIIKKIMK